MNSLAEIHQLGATIRDKVRAADLDAAGRLAVERHQRVVDWFSSQAPEQEKRDKLAENLQSLLAEDRELIDLLAVLRRRLEQELGEARRGLKSADAYLEVASR